MLDERAPPHGPDSLEPLEDRLARTSVAPLAMEAEREAVCLVAQALLVVVLAGEASQSALLSLSVGMKLTILVVNLILGFAALAIMARTLDWRGLRRRRDEEAAAEGSA